MQQSGILIFLVVIVAGVFVFALLAKYLRDRTEDHAPKLPSAAKAISDPADPFPRSPIGSMAARREDIEDLLRGKEDQPE